MTASRTSSPIDKPEIEVTQRVGTVTVLANLRRFPCGILFAANAFAWPTTTPAYFTCAAWACWLAHCCTGWSQARFCGRKPARPFWRVRFLILGEAPVTESAMFRDV